MSRCPSRLRPAIAGPARYDASDLAGIAFRFFSPAKPTRSSRSSCSAGHRADHRRDAGRRAGQPDGSGVYNSIYVIDHSGGIVALYDKVHLVPFGEFCRSSISLKIWACRRYEQRGGFLAGDRTGSSHSGRSNALPLICYEIVFPGDVVPPGDPPGLDRQCHQ